MLYRCHYILNYIKRMKKTILAVGAHPDDLDFGCPVMVRNLIKKGYEAYYVVVTNGENGSKENKVRTRGTRISTRKIEQLDAAKKIGVKKVIFLGYKDGFLQYSERLRKRLTILIKEIRPEFVFSFDPANQDFDNLNLFHRDHRITAIATFDACFAAKNDFIIPHKNGKHMVSKMYFFGSNKPNYFLNITKDINFKLDVLGSYKSQFPNFENFKKWFLGNLTGWTKKYKYSEAFRVMDVIQIGF